MREWTPAPPNQRARLNEAVAWNVAHGWHIVWHHADDVLLCKWVLPAGYRLDVWERVRRLLRLTRPDYQRWWIAADDELRSCRSDRVGRDVSETRRPL
jgi:hypothetical protein